MIVDAEDRRQIQISVRISAHERERTVERRRKAVFLDRL